MIAAAQKNFPGVDFRLGDATNLAFADEAFDAVLAVDIIPMVRNWERVLQESYRVSRRWLVMRVRTLVADVMPTQVLTVGNKLLSSPFVIFNCTELSSYLNNLQPKPAGHQIISFFQDNSLTQDVAELQQYRLPAIKRDDGTFCVSANLDLAILKFTKV